MEASDQPTISAAICGIDFQGQTKQRLLKKAKARRIHENLSNAVEHNVLVWFIKRICVGR